MNDHDDAEVLSFSERFHRFCRTPLETLFHKFRNGAIYFGVGGIMIYMANVALEPSIMQELVMLGGLILGSIGFFIAMTAQLRMILTRVYNFFFE